MKRRATQVALILLLAFSFLAGCGGGNNSRSSQRETEDANGSRSNAVGASEDAFNRTGNSDSNLSNMGLLAEQGEWLYYARVHENSYALERMRKDGSKKEVLVEDILPIQINVVGNWCYYIQMDGSTSNKGDNGRIFRVKIEEPETIEQMGTDLDIRLGATASREGSTAVTYHPGEGEYMSVINHIIYVFNGSDLYWIDARNNRSANANSIINRILDRPEYGYARLLDISCYQENLYLLIDYATEDHDRGSLKGTAVFRWDIERQEAEVVFDTRAEETLENGVDTGYWTLANCIEQAYGNLLDPDEAVILYVNIEFDRMIIDNGVIYLHHQLSSQGWEGIAQIPLQDQRLQSLHISDYTQAGLAVYDKHLYYASTVNPQEKGSFYSIPVDFSEGRIELQKELLGLCPNFAGGWILQCSFYDGRSILMEKLDASKQPEPLDFSAWSDMLAWDIRDYGTTRNLDRQPAAVEAAYGGGGASAAAPAEVESMQPEAGTEPASEQPAR